MKEFNSRGCKLKKIWPTNNSLVWVKGVWLIDYWCRTFFRVRGQVYRRVWVWLWETVPTSSCTHRMFSQDDVKTGTRRLCRLPSPLVRGARRLRWWASAQLCIWFSALFIFQVWLCAWVKVILILLTSITMGARGGTSRYRWSQFKEGTMHDHRQSSKKPTCVLVAASQTLCLCFSLCLFLITLTLIVHNAKEQNKYNLC